MRDCCRAICRRALSPRSHAALDTGFLNLGSERSARHCLRNLPTGAISLRSTSRLLCTVHGAARRRACATDTGELLRRRRRMRWRRSSSRTADAGWRVPDRRGARRSVVTRSMWHSVWSARTRKLTLQEFLTDRQSRLAPRRPRAFQPCREPDRRRGAIRVHRDLHDAIVGAGRAQHLPLGEALREYAGAQATSRGCSRF